MLGAHTVLLVPVLSRYRLRLIWVSMMMFLGLASPKIVLLFMYQWIGLLVLYESGR